MCVQQNKPDYAFLIDVCPCIFSSFPKSDNDFVEDFLVDKYFNTIYTDLAERRAKHWPHRTPNDLLNFYNVIIEHLADVSSSKEIENISWPIPELKKMVLDVDD